jgi:hypothetical protein
MKKLFFGLIATVGVVFIGNAQDIKEISSDEDLINYVKNEYVFSSQAKDYNTLQRLNEDKVISKDELLDFYSVFNTTEKKFSDYINSQNYLLNKIEKKYDLSKRSRDELTMILEPIVANVVVQSNSNQTLSRNCLGVYVAQLALNASIAYGAHVACLGADITFFAGVLCHGAVAIGQAAANYIAQEEYFDCVKEK